jgi:hypothetical protein
MELLKILTSPAVLEFIIINIAAEIIKQITLDVMDRVAKKKDKKEDNKDET